MMNNKLAYFKVTLIKPNPNVNKKKVWIKAKHELTFKDYCSLLEFLSKQEQYRDVFNLDEILMGVRDIIAPRRDLLVFKSSQEAILLKEILGTLAYLNLYRDRLDRYFCLRNEYEKSLLKNNIEEASSVLSIIENEFGISFWILESNFLVNNYKDLSTARSYYENIKELCEDNYYLKIFVRCIYKRTSKLIDFENAKKFIDRKAADLRKRTDVNFAEYAYFDFYNSYKQSTNFLDLVAGLLPIVDYLSIVDLYNLIDKTVQILLVEKSISKKSKVLLQRAINDLNFSLLCTATVGTSLEQSIVDNPLTIKMYDVFKYFNEEYNVCICKSLELINEYPNEFDLILLVSQLNVVSNVKLLDSKELDKGLLKDLCVVITDILKKDIPYNKFVDFEDRVAKLLYQLLSTTLFFPYRNFYLDNFSEEYESIECEYSYIGSKYCNIRSVFCLSGEFTNSKKISTYYVSDWLTQCNILDGIEYDRISLFLKRIGLLSIDELKEVYENGFDIFSDNQNIIIRNAAARFYFDKLVMEKEYFKAITFYINLALNNQVIVRGFNIYKLICVLTQRDIDSLSDDVNFCVFADLTNFMGTESLGYNLVAVNALEEILYKNSVQLPSNLKVQEGQEKQYCYLFRHVCTEELLERYFKYNLDYTKINDLFVLEERKKLLTRSLELENDDFEKLQIKTQLDNVNDRIFRLNILPAKEKKIDAHYISKERLKHLDVRIIMQFVNLLEELQWKDSRINEENFVYIKELLIAYKKTYFSLLDEQIGINIRHGFFCDEILNFFEYHGIFILKKDSENDTEVESTVIENKCRQLAKLHREDLIPNVKAIWNFSKYLYSFINSELYNIKIVSSSSPLDAELFKVYIEESKLYDIGNRIFNLKDPYRIQKILWEEYECIVENLLCKIRADLKVRLFSHLNCVCKKANEVYGVTIETADIERLADGISKWFTLSNDDNKMCSVRSYINELQQKNNLVNFIPISNNDLYLSLKQIHVLEIIINNLIFNAKNHGAMETIIVFEYDISSRSVALTMTNDLEDSKADKIDEAIKKVENYIKKKNADKKSDDNLPGMGYKHIIHELESNIVEDKWRIHFNKSKLPKQFEVMINFHWSQT